MTTDALDIISDSNIQIGKFRLARTGLVVSGAPSYEEWQQCGEFLTQAEKAIQFWIGDWVGFGEGRYGEKYAQALDETGLEYQTLANAKYVASHVEFSRRRENLSFSHHAEVAALDPAAQDRLLDDAERQGMDRKEFREHVRTHKYGELEPVITKMDDDPWRVERGQVWTLGRHRVMCGDAYSSDDLARLVGTDTVAALITDPPYGIDYQPDWKKWNGAPSDFRPVTGDDTPFDPTPFLNFPTIAMFGANNFSHLLPVGGWACWDKRLEEQRDAMFGSPFELAWFRSSTTTRTALMIRVLHGGVVNADSTNGNNDKRHHPTQKPVEVMVRLIDELTRRGAVILDPFCGSGSTLLACEASKRRCLAMDIEPHNVSITLARWAALTGELPCRE